MLCNELQARIHSLAVQIADDAARSDIEVRCPSFTDDGREPITAEEIRSAWYDVSAADEESARTIRLAVSYLGLRGKIVRHPSEPNWIRLVTSGP